jgi:hypothetical protein
MLWPGEAATHGVIEVDAIRALILHTAAVSGTDELETPEPTS